MPLNEANRQQFYDLVEHYRGTCNNLAGSEDEVWLEEQGLLEEWDNEIFECEVCGWMCGDDERSFNDDMICTDCEED